MKYPEFLYTIILFYLCLSISAQTPCLDYINIPDDNFKEVLVSDKDINTDGDGEISCSEASSYSGSLHLGYRSISDLSGIEYFEKLTVLDCSNNQITSLDLSNNTLLESFSSRENFSLASIDLSNNTVLSSISCSKNYALKSLDVSHNIGLKTLYCDANSLENLDVSNNKLLETLSFYENDIETIDLSNNTNLNYLRCYSNKLSTLDISNNIKLTELYCRSNDIVSLDVSNNPDLIFLFCSQNEILDLDVSKNLVLRSLICNENLLTEIDVTNNVALGYLDCYNNNITSIDVSKNIELFRLWASGNKIKTLDISNNPRLRIFTCYDNELVSLNVKNGNNSNMSSSDVTFTGNSNLTCIEVDDVDYSNETWSTDKDETASFSEDCNDTSLSSGSFAKREFNIYPNPSKEFINIQLKNEIYLVELFDLLGNKVLSNVSDKINISHLENGIYIIAVTTEGGKKISKEIIKH